MRRAVTPAIPPSMYRHFAIVTVALTMGLAMFADGENREARVAQATTVAPVRSAAPAAFAAGSADPSTQAAGWNDAPAGGFGQPMETAGGIASSLIPDIEPSEAPGQFPQASASLSQDEREMLLRRLQESALLAQQNRGSRSAAVDAASARRSGRAS